MKNECKKASENHSQIVQKSRKNASKNRLNTALSRPLGADPASRASPEPSWRGSGAARGVPKIVFGGLGEPLGREVDRFHPPGGSPGGSRRGSGRSFWEHFCCKACRHEKSKKINQFSLFLEVVFKCVFYVFSSPSPRRRRKSAP